MSLVFTNTDKGLLQRAARNLDEIAKGLSKIHGPVWSATKEGVKAKLVFDRLQRDMRDLRAMGKRLVAVNKLLMESPVIITTGHEVRPWPFPSGAVAPIGAVVPGGPADQKDAESRN